MTLDKALEILEASIKTAIPDFDHDLKDAVALGAHALERIRYERVNSYPLLQHKLQGED